MYLEILSSSQKRYIFDALSNEIYNLDNDFQIPKNSTREDLNLPYIERVVNPLPNTKELINTSAKTLILELTEKCNLRCSYCIFDEKYANERNHSNIKLDRNLAKKRIKEFSFRAPNDAYIIFYGGEPLLEFNSIVELTNYSKNIFGNRVKFSFTTNGMALTPDKFKFFYDNDFLITVSLDGFKKKHDEHRFTINNDPSWDKIMKNLEKLKSFSKDYYEKKIIINNVVESLEYIPDINNEINNSPLLKRKEIRFSFTIQNSILETKNYNNSNQNNYNNLINIFIQNDFQNNLFYKDKLLSLVKKIAFRTLGKEAQMGKKRCVPFVNRTYIRTNGNIQFCERISSYKKIENQDDLLKESEKIQEEFYKNQGELCLNCFAYNFCELCPASFYSSGFFSKDHIKICDNFRNEFYLALKIYLDLKEKDISLSDYE